MSNDKKVPQRSSKELLEMARDIVKAYGKPPYANPTLQLPTASDEEVTKAHAAANILVEDFIMAFEDEINEHS